MTNESRALYVGVTNDLERRVLEHKTGIVPGFTSRYRINRIVWYEWFTNVHEAITCEKRLKGWIRAKKVSLIESANPHWEDLSSTWNRSGSQ